MAMTANKQQVRGRSSATLAARVGDALAVLGVVAGCVPLFLHGWVHIAVRFAPRSAGGGLLSRLGTEADKQIAAIAAREVDAAVSPTLWQYPSHVYQALFVLLLLVAAVIFLAPSFPPRWRVAARAGACLSSGVAIVLVAVAFARINARIATLPARITEAMQGNALVRQSLAMTDSTPQVSGGPGWPMIVVAVGVALALLGTLARLILALRRSGTPAILPRTRTTDARSEETAHGDTGSAAAIPDDGPAANAHRDAPAI